MVYLGLKQRSNKIKINIILKPDELEELVFELIDKNVDYYSKLEYLDFLRDIRSDLDSRIEAAEQELEEEN